MSSCKKAAPKGAKKDIVEVASDAIISCMRRTGVGLGDMYHAITRMIDAAVADTVVRLRESGCSIRKIARTVHMDDGRVSKIVNGARTVAKKEAKKVACDGSKCRKARKAFKASIANKKRTKLTK